MKRMVLGLIAAAIILAATSTAMAHGPYGYPRGYRAGFYAGQAPVYGPYCGGAYYPRRVYYPVYPVYPVAPVYPAYPRSGFNYFSPGFSFSVAN